MTILDKAKEWALLNLKDDDTVAILLVGSWARGSGTDVNDIDLIVIKEYQLVGIAQQEHSLDGFTLDIWIHDKNAIEDEMNVVREDLNQINNLSMILAFLTDLIIWYEKEPFIEKLRIAALNWKWDDKYQSYFDFEYTIPTLDYLQSALSENVELLEVAKSHLQTGKAISHRRKDYPELLKEANELQAKTVLDLTEKAYLKLGIERHWTEFQDARKAVQTGQWSDALASLKDVLRFIIRYELPSVPEQLLDPSIWSTAESMSLSDETKNALKEAYIG